MPRLTYEEILSEARSLDAAQQLRLLEELAATVRRDMVSGGGRSILELRGLGKEVWQHADAQRYVDGERATWGG